MVKKITKTAKSGKLKAGIDRKTRYNLETECLLRLQKNNECICKKKCNHFPRIISSNAKKFQFTMTHMGISLDKLHKKDFNLNEQEMEEQIKCIFYQLEKSNIKHLDAHYKNYCLKDKVLAQIDFDIAMIDNRWYSTQINVWRDSEGRDHPEPYYPHYTQYTLRKLKQKYYDYKGDWQPIVIN